MSTDTHTITRLLQKSDRDSELENRLAVLLNDRMRRIARKLLGSGRRSPLWDTTGLSDEALLKMLRGRKRDWNNREHFYAVSTLVIRQTLLDYAEREFEAQKRGAGHNIYSLEEWAEGRSLAELLTAQSPESLLIVAELADRLRAKYPEAGAVFDHHFFAQYSLKEIAEELRVGTYEEVQKRWRLAKMFLAQELGRTRDG